MAVNLEKLLGRQIRVYNPATNNLASPFSATPSPPTTISDITVDAVDKDAGLILGHYDNTSYVIHYTPAIIIELVGANAYVADP